MKNDPNLDMLYTIIQNLQNIQAPIAIKGGLLLNASLQQHMSPISRKTRDIDGNWLQKQPNIEDMQQILEQAVQQSYPDYIVIIKRNYGDKQSAGFLVLDDNEEIITTFDIDVNKSTDTTSYQLNDITFQGIPIEQMLSDKISVISSPSIMRRTKDILDVYAITQNIPYDKEHLIQSLAHRNIGDFSTFHNNKNEIEHAYEKIRGVTNKPDFNTVYTAISNYCTNISKEIIRFKRIEKTKEFEPICQKAEQQNLKENHPHSSYDE